jgi:uncharacterized protein YciI
MPSQTLSQYLYMFGPGPRPELAMDPDSWSDEDRSVGSRHFAYLSEATEEGTVLLAGRCPDGVGPAVVIFDAASQDEAQRFMENDPFISSGLFTASLHEFNASLIRS